METVMQVVDKALELYMREDYDYVVSLAKEGQRPVGIDTVEEMSRHLIINYLIEEESILIEAAEAVLAFIKALEEDIFNKFNK